MSQRYFMSEHGAHSGSYAELRLRRRRIEAQIARHKVRIVELIGSFIAPRNWGNVVSGFALDGVKRGFSLLKWVSRGWQWLSFVRRIVKSII